MLSLADGVPSPRFGLPLQTVRTFEAKAGRKEMLAFAKRQQDLDLKRRPSFSPTGRSA